MFITVKPIRITWRWPTKLIKKVATDPLPLDFPVRAMEDWLKLKPLFTFREERIDWDAVDTVDAAQRQRILVVGRIPGEFDAARELMGEEVACLVRHVVSTGRDGPRAPRERVLLLLILLPRHPR